MLRNRFKVIVQSVWDGSHADAMIALHARRSAESIAGFRARHRSAGLAVVLTGTDLYRDLPGSREAIESLDAADRIIVLQDDAMRHLKASWRAKARVIFQSAPALRTGPRPVPPLKCIAVGHLRAEKDPLTLFAAIEQLPEGLAIRMRHLGASLDPVLGKAARTLQRREPRYRYSGALPHGLARAAIARSHVLVHPSIAEGGANVIVEAVTAGTAVLASRISGNVGMLGTDYPGYFSSGDASGLAGCLVRAVEEPAYLRRLRDACAERRWLFAPAAETRALQELAASLVE
jgi:putative glycosyltransferase (TIGR04348 family)